MRTAAVCLTVLMIASVSSAQSAPLAEKLPAKSIVYIGYAGTSAELEQSRLVQFMKEPGIQNIFTTIHTAVKTEAPGKKEKLMVDAGFTLAKIVWKCPIAVSLVEVTKTPKGPRPKMIMLIELGTHRAEFEKQLNTLLKDAPLSDGEAGELDLKILTTPPGIVSMGYIGNMFFMTLGQDVPKTLTAVTKATSLSSSASFNAAIKTVTGPNLQTLSYVNTPEYVKMLKMLAEAAKDHDLDGDVYSVWGAMTQAMAQGASAKMPEMVGLGKATASVSSTRLVKGGMLNKSRIITPAPHTGILSLIQAKPLTSADLADAPADAHLVMAGRNDIKKAWKLMLELMRSAQPQAMDEDERIPSDEKIDKEFREATGVSLQDDLLAHLGQRWMLVSAPSYGGFFTGTVLIVDVANPGPMQATLERIKAKMTPKKADDDDNEAHDDDPMGFAMEESAPVIKSMQSGQATIYYLAMGGMGGGFFPMPFSPAWAVHNGKAYIGLYPQTIAAAIAYKGEKLTDTKAFSATQKNVSADGSMLAYINTPKLIRSAYTYTILVWTMASGSFGSEIPMDPTWMPPVTTFEKYFSPMIMRASTDAAGVMTESYGTVPLSDGAAGDAIGGIVQAVVVAAVTGEKGGEAPGGVVGDKAASMANLKRIGAAVIEYNNIFGKSPRGPADLVEASLVPANVFKSPRTKGEAPTYANGQMRGRLDYIIIRYAKFKDVPGKTMLAFENPGNWEGKGTVIVTANGTVRWVSTKEWQQLYTQAMRVFQQQRRGGAEKPGPPKAAPAPAKGP